MSLMQLLNLRADFEGLTQNFFLSVDPWPGSCINTLKWFVEHGHRSNSLRNGFEDAKQIAVAIIKEHKKWQQQKGLNQDQYIIT